MGWGFSFFLPFFWSRSGEAGSSKVRMRIKANYVNVNGCCAKMPPRTRVKKQQAAQGVSPAERPYVERGPDDGIDPVGIHSVDLNDRGWIYENGVHTFVGYDYTIHYVRAPPNLPGFQVGTKLKVLRRGVSEEGCPFGVGLMYLELEHDLVAVFTGKKGIAWMRR